MSIGHTLENTEGDLNQISKSSSKKMHSNISPHSNLPGAHELNWYQNADRLTCLIVEKQKLIQISTNMIFFITFQWRYSHSIRHVSTHCGLIITYGDRSCSALAQVMAYCSTAPSHNLNQCLLPISEVQWQSQFHERDLSHQLKNQLENHLYKISFKYPRGQC